VPEDFRQGRCRKTAEGKYDCTPAASLQAGSPLGACNYQCGVSLCCVAATEAECAARPHSRFIEGDADACPAWANPGGRR
jgi:hypothetical protein